MGERGVVVVGAGISGVAAARALASRGVTVHVVDRARVVGGRMASKRIDGRPVDIGASYFTAEAGSAFDAVVQDWVARGIARPWTDSFATADDNGLLGTSTGPVRYSAPAGLRALVTDLAGDLDVRLETPFEALGPQDPDASSSGATVLAMPGPQARRLLAVEDPLRDQLDDEGDWQPTLAAVLRFERREWAADLHGAFVNDSPAVGFIADDGDRRGDGAPVLVVHSTPALARQHLDDPEAALQPMLATTLRILGITAEPVATHVHRWTFAKPAGSRDAPFLLDSGRGMGVCGDGWGGRSSVGAAWTSGDALGTALALTLA